MLACKLVRRALFSMVLTAGVAFAGDVFGATAAADTPRELSMRALPTYRIEPPDILQIEITNLKAAGKAGRQSSDHSDQGGLLGITETDSHVGSLTKTGAGKLTVSGSTTNGGNITSPSLTKPGTGAPAIGPGYALTLTFDNASPTNASGGTWMLSSGADVRGDKLSIQGNPNTGAAMSPGTATMMWRMRTSDGDTNTALAKSPDAKEVTGLGGAVSARIEKMASKAAKVPPASGQYMVSPDGTVNLRQCGTVQVMGLTIAEAKAALEKQLSKYFDAPEVSVDVVAYNSKVYYIITEGAGLGDNVRRIPICGKETVLDALATINGLSQVSSKRIWIARPSPSNPEKGTTLRVDYASITQRAATATNYQIMPGDRIFIAEDRITALNNWLTKMTMPIERIMGVISLGASTIRSIQGLLPEEAHP